MAMRINEAAKLAARGIRSNIMRAFLTSLGIIIGVAAVIIIIAIGEGARAEVLGSIESLGTNIIFVMQGEGKPVKSPGQSSQLNMDVMEELEKMVPHLESIAADASRSGIQVKFGKDAVSSTIIGVTGGYLDVRGYEVAEGRAFTADEIARGELVAMVSEDMASDLFKGTEPVGQKVSSAGMTFRVIGVFKSEGTNFFQQMAGFRILQMLLPMNTVQRRITGGEQLTSIYLKIDDAKYMDAAAAATERALLIKMGYEENFRVTNQADILDIMSTVTGTMTYLLAGIAAVSLVVGGIGIMNIMLVSVTERIREIGIRKALGATKRDILAQFLMEAVMISFSGGAVGMLMGWGVASLVSRLAGWPSLVPWYSIALALGFSLGIGLFFGVYPANKAASLQPVDALRYE